MSNCSIPRTLLTRLWMSIWDNRGSTAVLEYDTGDTVVWGSENINGFWIRMVGRVWLFAKLIYWTDGTFSDIDDTVSTKVGADTVVVLNTVGMGDTVVWGIWKVAACKANWCKRNSVEIRGDDEVFDWLVDTVRKGTVVERSTFISGTNEDISGIVL